MPGVGVARSQVGGCWALAVMAASPETLHIHGASAIMFLTCFACRGRVLGTMGVGGVGVSRSERVAARHWL